jgi:hypothetical protein
MRLMGIDSNTFEPRHGRNRTTRRPVARGHVVAEPPVDEAATIRHDRLAHPMRYLTRDEENSRLEGDAGEPPLFTLPRGETAPTHGGRTSHDTRVLSPLGQADAVQWNYLRQTSECSAQEVAEQREDEEGKQQAGVFHDARRRRAWEAHSQRGEARVAESIAAQARDKRHAIDAHRKGPGGGIGLCHTAPPEPEDLRTLRPEKPRPGGALLGADDEDQPSTDSRSSSSDAAVSDVEFREIRSRVQALRLARGDAASPTADEDDDDSELDRLAARAQRVLWEEEQQFDPVAHSWRSIGTHAVRQGAAPRPGTRTIVPSTVLATAVSNLSSRLANEEKTDRARRRMVSLYDLVAQDPRRNEANIGLGLFQQAEKMLDRFSLVRSADQRRFHQAILTTTAPLVMRDDFNKVREEFLASRGRTAETMGTIILCPRRWGKSISVAMVMAALLRVGRGLKIVIFSTGASSSSTLLRMIKDFFNELEGGSQARVVKSTAAAFFTLPADQQPQGGSNRTVSHRDCNSVLAMSGNVTGTTSLHSTFSMHMHAKHKQKHKQKTNPKRAVVCIDIAPPYTPPPTTTISPATPPSDPNSCNHHHHHIPPGA